MLVVVFIAILAGCNTQHNNTNYHLTLMGKSEHWGLIGYEVVITPEELKAGNGTLNMKNKNKYITNSFHFETHAVIADKDITVHSGSVTGAGIDIAEETTGAIEGGTYLNEKGEPITLDNIRAIYMIVGWWDMSKGESVKERIDLYNQPKKEKTFLK
ncbi:hypothetical protein [Halobacillus naozhouensis]|uniref:Uncharacterized protein n=1 Tax=Halobacillus naozhouensis TaxID=554880 RepID=A0ABY8IWE2_9BACI|nr:hypothetical protein [Halobacillus naozhouensis]WFT74056.1 hypothetical protein P9989_17025 [Halobacillus naozhouensis]